MYIVGRQSRKHDTNERLRSAHKTTTSMSRKISFKILLPFVWLAGVDSACRKMTMNAKQVTKFVSLDDILDMT